LLAALVAALALLVAHLLDCIPGFGTGGDPSSGRPVPAEPAPAEPAPDEQVEGSGRAVVVVRGAKCELDGEPASLCETVCERLRSQGAVDRVVEVDATHGSHGAVEALERCLTEAGFSNVNVRSE
jgi:hypothetical protein